MAYLAPFVALALASAGSAGPDNGPRALAVVSLSAPARLTFLGKRVADRVAESARRAVRGRVLGPDAVERRLGRIAARELSECAGLVRCVSERASSLGVDRVVSGYLAQAERSYVFEMVLVDVRSGQPVTSVTREVPIASRRLLREVALAAPALLRGEPDAAGTLIVLSDVAGAEIEVDGKCVGRAPLTLKVNPGRHRVRVRQAGYAEQEPHWVDVPARETVRDRVRLTPVRAVPPNRGRRSAGPLRGR